MGGELTDIHLQIDSNVEGQHTTYLDLDGSNVLMLKAEDSNGKNGAQIHFGQSGTALTPYTKLTVKPYYDYNETKGVTTHEGYSTPHLERLMLDSVAIENNYTENLYATESAKMPFLSKNDGNTHVVLANNEGNLTVSSITSTEVYRLLGVTSNIQDQLNAITSALAIGYKNSGYKTVSMATDTLTNIASVKLTAGTWLLVGGIRYTQGSGAQFVTTELSIHTNTTAMNTNPTNYAKQQESTIANETSALNATTIVTVSSDTTYYLNGRVKTAGSNSATTAYGRLFGIKIPTI